MDKANGSLALHSRPMATLLRRPPLPPVFSASSTSCPPSQLLPFKTPKPIKRRTAPISSSSFRNWSNSPAETECPVPFDQQPINEYQTLSTSFPFSWASGDLVEYCSRLFVTGESLALFVGLPVAEPIERALGAASSWSRWPS